LGKVPGSDKIPAIVNANAIAIAIAIAIAPRTPVTVVTVTARMPGTAFVTPCSPWATRCGAHRCGARCAQARRMQLESVQDRMQSSLVRVSACARSLLKQ